MTLLQSRDMQAPHRMPVYRALRIPQLARFDPTRPRSRLA